MLMLNGGGRSLEDLRQIRDDHGLREVLELKRMPCGQFEANAVFQAFILRLRKFRVSS